jgi:lipoprotein
MKNKNFLRVLAIVCVLVLCVGVLAACNKGSGGGNQGDGTGGGGETGGGGSTGNQAGASMNAFVNTMFQSANEIANGTSFELADGKNIALSLGATITLKKDSGVAGEIMPIELALKGFLDRQNVTDKYIDDANGAYVLIDGKYVSYDASLHEGQTRYSKAVALTEDNETYIDVSARINGVDSFRLIYEKDFLYATIAGNKVGVDLSKLEKTANGQTVKDALFTKIEGLLKNNIVKSVVEAFNGGDFDLNEVITGLINTFVKKEYMPYSDTLVNAANRTRYNFVNGEYVKAADGTHVVKTLADTIFEKDISFIGISINTMLSDIFGGEEKFYSYFGETLDVQGILTADLKGTPFASNLFSEPTWYTWKNGQFQEANKGYSSVKSDLSQKLSATIALNPFSFGDSIALTKNSAIKLGFEKEAGANGSIGKMSKFFIDLNLPAGENNRTFGIELAITDLKIGNSKDAISTTAVNKEDYGAMNIDAGLDFDFGEDLLSLVAHDYTSPNGLTFKVGGDDLKYDALANTLTVPKTLKLNIKGTLDFVNIQNTRAVATITANDKVFAKLQLYSANIGTAENPDYDLQLDAKIMEEYKGVLPGILDMCVALGKNGAIGINGFKKVGGKWGFYAEDGTDKVGGVLYSVYEEHADGNYGKNEETGEYFLLTADNSATYTGAKYKKFNVSYSFAKVNESIDHLMTSGEAHVKGLNFVKLVNYLINKNGNGLFVNYDDYKAEAAAENDITIGDVIMNLLLKDNVGIIPAVYGLIGINQADGLDNSLVIGGEKLLATTFKNLFEYNNNNIDAVSMIALAMKYFTKYQVDLKGKTYDSVAVYKEFETELYKLTARGIYAQGLSKQLLLLRPTGYMTKGEEFFANHKETATTAIMHENGHKEYAVVEDSAGNKYLYPYVLYTELELAVKKNNVKYLSDEGFEFKDGKLVLINTPDVLKQAIVDELNRTAGEYTESNYIDGKAGSLLRQAYRLGKTYVPYFDKTANSWKVEEIAAAGTSANAEIIDDIALKVIIGTKKDGDRETYGTATVEGKVYGKTFSIKGYVNYLTEAPEITKENLISDETKGKAFEIQIINPQTYNK